MHLGTKGTLHGYGHGDCDRGQHYLFNRVYLLSGIDMGDASWYTEAISKEESAYYVHTVVHILIMNTVLLLKFSPGF